jgi:hypothetical protein
VPSTVRGDIQSWSPISAEVQPSQSIRRTCLWRVASLTEVSALNVSVKASRESMSSGSFMSSRLSHYIYSRKSCIGSITEPSERRSTTTRYLVIV